VETLETEAMDLIGLEMTVLEMTVLEMTVLEMTVLETTGLETTGLETTGLETTGLETTGLETTGLELKETRVSPESARLLRNGDTSPSVQQRSRGSALALYIWGKETQSSFSTLSFTELRTY
jgi:hypothetical protein